MTTSNVHMSQDFAFFSQISKPISKLPSSFIFNGIFLHFGYDICISVGNMCVTLFLQYIYIFLIFFKLFFRFLFSWAHHGPQGTFGNLECNDCFCMKITMDDILVILIHLLAWNTKKTHFSKCAVKFSLRNLTLGAQFSHGEILFFYIL